ncbi:undecaprenyl-phosphate glucose phosphotransferase [Dyella sp. C11]|uniref:undecaprenyl-phosphate glucose phosphotransferase n=1 Tax=Dyella sp. C11 TaxID=2126991 RepID=UPI000D6446A2|nr:undecaprenyl-phosphate glucose phosphotransferase [Dyella sp. C11]
MLTMPGVPQLKRAESHFFSKYAALLDIALRVSDVLVITVMALAVYRWEFGNFSMDIHYTSGLIRTVLLALVIFPATGLYRSWRGENRLFELARLWLAWSGVMVMLLAIAWALKTTDAYSRVGAGTWFVTTGVLLTIDRLALRWVLGHIRMRGVDSRRVLLIGSTQAGQRIVNAARKNAWAGLDIIGYVRTPYDQVEIDGVPCLGDFDDIAASFDGWEPDQVWVALPMRAEAMIQKVLQLTIDKPSTIRLVPDFFGYELINHHAAVLNGVPVITLRASRVTGHSHIVKGMMDRAISAVLLLVISPLMLVLALGVKLSSRGPVFYRQRRVGMDGKEFDMLKFRSMPVDAESKGVQWGNAGNKTTTRFGRFIRSSSLDELPQFINVLRGELSIVGPRPERPVFVHEFKRTIPGYMHKHFVKGGITGWAQINGLRGDTDLAKRIEYDLHYIKNWSLWLDVKIMLRTPLVLLKRTNAV